MNSSRRRASAVALVFCAALAACSPQDDEIKPSTVAPPGGEPAAPAPDKPAPAPQGIHFTECAESAGLRFTMRFLPDEQGERFKINLYDHGCGVAVADIDGDGKDDVFLANQLGPCGLFRNVGEGKFEDAGKAAGDLAASLDGKIAVGASFADVDGDGDQDLYVATTRAGNVFFLNAGGGKFTDATKEAGLTLVAESEQPCFFDADGDGDLDLLVTNTARWTLDVFDEKQRYYVGKPALDDLIASEKEPNNFYLNDGAGRFTDATKESGLAGKGWSGDTAVFDFDADGDLDVFVVNMFGSSILHRNDGKGRFEDVTRAVLGKTSWGAVGTRAFDYDGDGLLDLYVVDMHSDMWIPSSAPESVVEERKRYRSFMARAVDLGLQPPAAEEQFDAKTGTKRDEVVFGNTLFRNKGNGKFEDVSQGAAVETWWPWGIVEGDFDADGRVDCYVPSGMGFPFFYARSPLLRNRGDGAFEDVCKTAGTEPPPGGPEMDLVLGGKRATRSSRSAATADFDGDGRVDLVVNNFNERAYLFRNDSPGRHWCGLRLVGAGKNRDAIGAVARLTAGGKTQIRQVQAAGGYLSQSSNVLHFGLGDVGEIESIEVVWPGGAKQTVKKPRIDALSTVTERAK